ncbi:TauD/TfdA dioxygenase family protein [Marinobacter sp. CA1]|uniref:TauD/TfdA dioxygenase family protein n=1 Tax=Marinobacter sp. CA1 TaxID=2817656 RepID=UPI001D060382|nr:TauD/TfdA family dioxygenase [Marinobacter sp. CA1]UDL07067.1 TauD/TfdA family dioxygenase [Marinobacter sp. CA1]
MFNIPLSMLIAPNAETNSVKRDYQHIQVKPYASALGAEIFGVDLANLTDEQTQEIKWALADHSVVFFREQDLSIEDQERFSLRFGEFGYDPFVDGINGHPNVLRLVKEADEKTGAVFGGVWHTDWSFQEAPPSYTILVGKDIPPYGGDTLFASLSNAYDSLSPAMKKICESLKLMHSAKKGYDDQMAGVYSAVLENMKVKTGTEDAKSSKLHPLVTVHPESGKKVLFLGGVYSITIQGMHFDESETLLNYLQEKVVQDPLNLCRFHWEKGSVAMWDNRCTQHYPMADYKGMRREMQRTIIAGEPPVGV